MNELDNLIGTLTFSHTDYYGETLMDDEDVFICPISKKKISENDLLDVQYGYALNKYVVRRSPHNIYQLKQVPYIIYKKWSFVFEIVDPRETYYHVLNILTTQLPIVVVDKIAFFMGCDKIKNTYILSDFKFNFESKYKINSRKVSIEQLKKLFELGIVKIACNETQSLLIMSDDAFDHVYPNNAVNKLCSRFKTKEKMHNYCRDKIAITFEETNNI